MRLAVVEFERAQWAKNNVVKREFPKLLFVPEADQVIPLIHEHIINNGHKLEVDGRNVICVKCLHSVPKSRVQIFENFDCLTDEVFDITCPEDFILPGPKHIAEDLLANLQPKLQKAQQELSRIKVESRQAISEAALLFVESLPKKGTTLNTAPLFQPMQASAACSINLPAWVKKLNPSHKLWSAGGLAFCQECGAVSIGRIRTRLSDRCGSRPGRSTTRPKLIGQGSRARRMPGGSEWKIRRLLSGHLAGLKEWPDGDSKEVIELPLKVFPTNPR
jgi:hypothetical protein